jgi:hypothetical protein
LDSQAYHQYSFSGIARQLKIQPLQISPPSGRQPYADIYLPSMQLTGTTATWSAVNVDMQVGLYSRETNVTSENYVSNTPQVTITVYPETTVDEVFISGREKLRILKGFSVTTLAASLYRYEAYSFFNSNSYPYFEFVAQSTTSLTGPSDPNGPSRTYVQNMYVQGDTIGVVNELRPLIEFNHGADINKLDYIGGGQLSFNQDSTADATRVSKGEYRTPLSIGSDPTAKPNVCLSSKSNSAAIGVNGVFQHYNPGSGNLLRYKLPGKWSFKITPI